MKTLSISAVVAMLILAAQSEARAQCPAGVRPVAALANVQPPCAACSSGYQTGYRHNYVAPPAVWRHHASTAAEGYLHGLAAVLYAQGAYNQMTAQARVIHAEAQAAEIAAHEQAVHSYYALRSSNREYRAAERGPRPTGDELNRLAKMGKPERLDQDQLNVLTGRVSWPTLLQGDEFAAMRAQLESLLALRAAKGNLDRDEQQQVAQVASAMRADLQKQIRSVSAMDYSAAQQFIKSFAHEVRQPLG